MDLSRHSPAEEMSPFTRVGDFDSLAEAEEHSLIILAMGLACLILESPGPVPRFLLLAGQDHADDISREFAAYAAENAHPAAPSPPSRVYPAGLEWSLLWVISLFVTFHLQGEEPWLTDALSNSPAALFNQGQWWRPLTALFLHADLAHLLGNAVYGLIFFPLVAQTAGPKRGWLLILGSGTLGNLASAWLRYPRDAASLGASTALFGALGVLAGVSSVEAWRSRSYRRLGGVLVPAGAGLCLLGWLGAGDAPTDVLGHLLGFLAGSVSGLFLALLRATPGRRQGAGQ